MAATRSSPRKSVSNGGSSLLIYKMALSLGLAAGGAGDASSTSAAAAAGITVAAGRAAEAGGGAGAGGGGGAASPAVGVRLDPRPTTLATAEGGVLDALAYIDDEVRALLITGRPNCVFVEASQS